ncbi:Uma2 family endonuclease [bacterium]|nr:Uma2 family endonuclease [bacterium]
MSLEQPREYPRGDTLPDSDGVPMESEWVCDQTRIYLVEPLRHYYRERQIVAFVGGNSFVYYPPDAKYLGPDFYVVRGGTQGKQTKWVPWEEGGLLPTTVIEFLSDSTESRDRGEKFCIYRDVFKTEDYFLIDPETLYIEAYHLEKGHYVANPPNPDGWFFVRSLGLFLGVSGPWIRLRTPEGELLTSGRESAQAERLRADKAEAELQALKEQLNRLKG